jgi:hypothetical protein
MQMIAPRVKSAFLTSDLLGEYMIQVELLGHASRDVAFEDGYRGAVRSFGSETRKRAGGRKVSRVERLSRPERR